LTSEKVNESYNSKMHREHNSQKNQVKSSTRKVAKGIFAKIHGLDVS